MRRWPVGEQTSASFAIAFVKKLVELARRRIIVQLLVPECLVVLADPLGNSPKFFWRQLVNCRFDFLDPTHVCSVT